MYVCVCVCVAEHVLLKYVAIHIELKLVAVTNLKITEILLLTFELMQ